MAKKKEPAAEALQSNGEAESNSKTAAQQAEQMSAEFQRYVNEGVAAMQQVANEYVEKVSEVADQAVERAGKVYEEGQAYVREHPGTTLVGAFAFGVLLGLLMRRR